MIEYVRRIGLPVFLILFSIHLVPKQASSSTVANTTTDCKYVDAAGKVVFEKKCLVYYGSLMAIEGVRKCSWSFFTVHFTSKAKAHIWISATPEKCPSTINGKKTNVEEFAYGKYNKIFLTEEGELFYLKFDEAT